MSLKVLLENLLRHEDGRVVRRDHIEMITALRRSRRGDLIELTRRHLIPSPAAYIRAYERRFGDSNGADQ